MNREFGISILYITHDLTTAYQISDQIIVLYRGAVAEVGDAELVVKHPQHPYTQLLIQSIPLVSTERTWTSDDVAGALSLPEDDGVGCRFSDRCPFVTALCRAAAPPLFQTDRAVACYLYQDRRGSPSRSE